MEKLRKCSCCQKEYPETKDFFREYSAKGKVYLSRKCKTCLKEYSMNYRQENRERLRDSMRKFDASAKGIYKKLKYSGRKHEVKISERDFVEWYQSQQKKCFYCGLREEDLHNVKDAYNNKTNRLSVDRMDSSRGYEMGNIVLCCLRCNHIKGDFFTPLEMAEIGQKYIARKWENAKQH